jgi:hypothetical protein
MRHFWLDYTKNLIVILLANGRKDGEKVIGYVLLQLISTICPYPIFFL